MKIKSYEMVEVEHSRSGKWHGIATRDFDTETEEWYPLTLAADSPAPMFASDAYRSEMRAGMAMPCRASHVRSIRVVIQ